MRVARELVGEERFRHFNNLQEDNTVGSTRSLLAVANFTISAQMLIEANKMHQMFLKCDISTAMVALVRRTQSRTALSFDKRRSIIILLSGRL